MRSTNRLVALDTYLSQATEPPAPEKHAGGRQENRQQERDMRKLKHAKKREICRALGIDHQRPLSKDELRKAWLAKES